MDEYTIKINNFPGKTRTELEFKKTIFALGE